MSLDVAILGASDKPDRFSNKAFHMLLERGHRPIPVSPSLKELDGTPVVPNLRSIAGPVHTLTMYVNATISDSLKEEILALKPVRIIFNPGSENPALMGELQKNGIQVVEACTLVLLRTGRFESSQP